MSKLSVNQSIFIYIRQPKPIVARPIHIKRKESTHNTVQYYHTDKREKRETKSLLERSRHLLPKFTPIFLAISSLYWFPYC